MNNKDIFMSGYQAATDGLDAEEAFNSLSRKKYALYGKIYEGCDMLRWMRECRMVLGYSLADAKMIANRIYGKMDVILYGDMEYLTTIKNQLNAQSNGGMFDKTAVYEIREVGK